MPHPSPRTPLSDRVGSWSVGICRMLLSDQRAGGCHTHPPCTPLSYRMGSWAAGVCRMLLSDKRAGGCHTHSPLHLPFRPHWFQVHMWNKCKTAAQRAQANRQT